MKISQYPPDAAPTSDDYTITVDATSGSNRKTFLSALISLFMTSPTIASPVVTDPPANIARLTGEMTPYAGRTTVGSIPTGWLECDGSAYSRTTYSALFAAITPLVGTCTITNATPAVVTQTGSRLVTGDAVYLTTTGTLPTGLTANTIYYAVAIDNNTFNLATTRANAYAGTKIATSSAGSGTHSLRYCPYGLGDGSTTFNVPDFRGRSIAGHDSMGGSAASRLTLSTTQGVYGNVGATGGAQAHTLTSTEQASMNIISSNGGSIVRQDTGGALGGWVFNPAGANSGQNSFSASGGGASHNVVQPTGVANIIIKT